MACRLASLNNVGTGSLSDCDNLLDTQDCHGYPQTVFMTGFLTRVTNPRGIQTMTSYQAFDAPSTDSPVRIEAPEVALTTITRDGFGKPLQVTRCGPGG